MSLHHSPPSLPPRRKRTKKKSPSAAHKRLYKHALHSMQKRELQQQRLLDRKQRVKELEKHGIIRRRPQSAPGTRRPRSPTKRQQKRYFERQYQEFWSQQRKMERTQDEIEKYRRQVQNRSKMSKKSQQLMRDQRSHERKQFKNYHDMLYAQAMKRIEKEQQQDMELYGFCHTLRLRPASAMGETKSTRRVPDYEREWNRTPFLSRFQEKQKQKQQKMEARHASIIQELRTPKSFMNDRSKHLVKDKDNFWKTVS